MSLGECRVSRTMFLRQRHSCRSSSCPHSFPPGYTNTAELREGSRPSSSASHRSGPTNRREDVHLHRPIREQWGNELYANSDSGKEWTESCSPNVD